ncbi:hypothetical protein [Thermococcus waiotapuensis]|uniref:Uncharacterized protein n=1 Tax=Thermococcus waiotapuensis TaxID=90909 RepID=A0AAE4T2Y0_9EURY|nr:hypothetical protein [Thermococcus waiotapuensis]MDV3103191.1 hypothetical protein [Thermococcus waiotapuensis]
MFAVLLGLLMLGVTAGSASATAMVLNDNLAPLQVRVSPLSVHDMIKIRSLVLNEIGAFGISKDELSLGNIHGYKAGSYSVFTIDTSKGAITGIYDGNSVALSKVMSKTRTTTVVQTITNGKVHTHEYSANQLEKFRTAFGKIEYYSSVSTQIKHAVTPDATFESHWYGWKVKFTEQETQDIIQILLLWGGVSSAARAIAKEELASLLAALGVAPEIVGIVAVALLAAGAYVYTVDAIGGHKGIYITQYFGGPVIIWHN